MITRPIDILNDIDKLGRYQIDNCLVKYFKEEFGLVVSVQRNSDYIDIYVGQLVDVDKKADNEKDAISKKVLKYYNSIVTKESEKADNVLLTNYGYAIVLNSDVLLDSKLSPYDYLDNIYGYYYVDYEGNPTNESKQINKSYKILREDASPSETKDKDSITKDISNMVLDSKYIWFFSVLDKDTEEIKGDIRTLDEAIDSLIENNGTFLVAYPYVDPNAEDENVELVFAENMGPVILYDGEGK